MEERIEIRRWAGELARMKNMWKIPVEICYIVTQLKYAIKKS